MEKIIEFTNGELFGVYVAIFGIILIVLESIQIIKFNKLKKKYNSFISKVSKGTNFEEMISEYVERVENTRAENVELKDEISKVNKSLMKCIQKVGIVRYNAFNDTGSDLSFAVALLDFEDNGIVLNGVYSRDNTTTTYAKSIEKGQARHALSKEESEAIEQSKRSSDKYFIEVKR